MARGKFSNSKKPGALAINQLQKHIASALGNDETSTLSCLSHALLAFTLSKQANQQAGGRGLEETVYTVNPIPQPNL